MKDPLKRMKIELEGAIIGIDGSKVADMGEEGSYKERCVANTKIGECIVDTALVEDNPPEFPYETAVSDPHYNDGSYIIVAVSSTKQAAQWDHDVWVQLMTTTKPAVLLEAGVSETAMRTDKAYGNREWRVYTRKE
jgi:hypothetical protein